MVYEILLLSLSRHYDIPLDLLYKIQLLVDYYNHLRNLDILINNKIILP